MVQWKLIYHAIIYHRSYEEIESSFTNHLGGVRD
jgi:hypothetical protein